MTSRTDPTAGPPLDAAAGDDKRLAALAAVAEVEDGMLLGLGTGSTARHAIDAIGALVAGGARLRAVATSLASARQAERLGIALLDMADTAAVDLTIDGADEIDPRLVAIKGAGGAMLREKVVAAASTRMLVIADGSKRVDMLGVAPLPVEVAPFALASVMRRVTALGAVPVLRMAAGERYRTDQDNLVLDCRFGPLTDPGALAAALQAIPGLVGHGLFLDQVHCAYVAAAGVVSRIERPA
ncbi:ribose-5-phosphate isomerase RpiA [Sphingomonas bacterium]|uniref:ribose-5-phosphate isomerase RpiA n=1 Tax=Sphingomonas bacterium TaxID=1895847 RepID=UPI001575E52E|nr:ribose-5-phosphate isomerase RpiA [Sphingomonas bacterium]